MDMIRTQSLNYLCFGGNTSVGNNSMLEGSTNCCVLSMQLEILTRRVRIEFQVLNSQLLHH